MQKLDVLKRFRHLHLGMCQFQFQYYFILFLCSCDLDGGVHIALHIVRTDTWVIYSLCVFILIYIAHLHELNLRAKLNTI